MYKIMLLILLMIEACRCSIEHRNGYLKRYFDLPEYKLLEFSKPYGTSFPSSVEDYFDSVRRIWRQGSSKFSSFRAQVSEIDNGFMDILLDDDGNLVKSASLPTMVKFLNHFWPQVDEEFPSLDEIGHMELDKFFDGEWEFVDEPNL